MEKAIVSQSKPKSTIMYKRTESLRSRRDRQREKNESMIQEEKSE